MHYACSEGIMQECWIVVNTTSYSRFCLLSEISLDKSYAAGPQRAHPKTLTTQIREGESHFTVTVPSTSLSQ